LGAPAADQDDDLPTVIGHCSGREDVDCRCPHCRLDALGKSGDDLTGATIAGPGGGDRDEHNLRRPLRCPWRPLAELWNLDTS